MHKPTAIALAAALTAAHSFAAESKPESAPADTSLPTVSITATRPAAGKTTMSGEELSRVPGTMGDPIRALQSLPGVVAVSDGNAAPAIRGSRPADNSYYVDFLPVGYIYHMGGFVSTVRPDLVRKVDLYTGAFGPEYDDVHGGIIDVALRRPKTDKISGRFNLSALGGDLLLEGPVSENQSFYIAAKRSWLDLVVRKKQTDSDSGVVYTLPKFNDYQGKYIWKLNSSNEVTLHALGAADRLQFSIPSDSSTAVHDPVLAGDGNFKMSSHTQGLVWDSTQNGWSNKLALGHVSNTSQANVGSAAAVDIQSDKYFLREQVRLRPAEKHELTLGGIAYQDRVRLGLSLLDAQCTEFDPQCDYTSATRKTVQESIRFNYGNLYAKDRWQLSDTVATTVGLHLTRDGYLKQNYAEPRLGVEWAVLPRTLISAGWGKHNEQPDGSQIIPTFGNPMLKHMRATQSVLGVTQTLGDGWSVKAEAYHKQFNQFAVADSVLNYVNGGSGTSNGVEFFVKKERTRNWSGWLSLSLARTHRTNDVTGQEFLFEYDQPVVLSLVGDYKLNAVWTLGAKWSYHSGNRFTPVTRTYTDATGRVRPVYGDLNSERLPAYHRLDIRADYVPSKRWSFYFEAINAYNHTNVSGYQYSADYKSRKRVAELSFTPNIGVEYKF